MKRTVTSSTDPRADRLALRSETIRMLTERELVLVVAGNCLQASLITQNATTDRVGIC